MDKKPVGRPKKEGQYINCLIQKNIAERLDKFVTETGLPKTSAVEHALIQYLDNYDKTGKI